MGFLAIKFMTLKHTFKYGYEENPLGMEAKYINCCGKTSLYPEDLLTKIDGKKENSPTTEGGGSEVPQPVKPNEGKDKPSEKEETPNVDKDHPKEKEDKPNEDKGQPTEKEDKPNSEA